MADLNKELNEYLLSNKNDKQYKLSMPTVTIPKSPLGKWFGKRENEEAGEASWYQETKKECCPTMVSV